MSYNHVTINFNVATTQVPKPAEELAAYPVAGAALGRTTRTVYFKTTNKKKLVFNVDLLFTFTIKIVSAA